MYNRVLELSTQLGNSVCELYERQIIVCHSNLKLGIFTTSAVDNIDQNPSSTTAQGSFHGKGISIFQHPHIDCAGCNRDIHTIESSASTETGLKQLPSVYRWVPPVGVTNKQQNIPACSDSLTRVSCKNIPASIRSEYM